MGANMGKPLTHGTGGYHYCMQIGLIENDPDFLDEVMLTIKTGFHEASLQYWLSGESFLKQEDLSRFEILFIDIMLPGISGIELCARLQELNFPGKIIILTNMNSDEMILQAIKHGAVGYLLKSETTEINSIIETVINGGAILTPTIALRVMIALKEKEQTRPEANLTPRLNEVLDLMVSGNSIAEVADILGIKQGTVNSYAKEIYKKLNVHNRAQLVGKVYRQ